MSRYLTLLHNICDIIWTANPNGQVIEPQSSWSDFTGQNFAEIKGYGWAQAVHTIDRERVMVEWQQAVITASTFTINARLFHAASQTYRLVESTAIPIIENDELVGWHGGMIDIDDKASQLTQLAETAQAQQLTIAERNRELHSQQNLLEKLIGSTSLLLIMIDADGCYNYINDTADSMISLPREALLGKHWTDLPIPEKTTEHLTKKIDLLYRNKTSIEDKLWIPTAGRLRLYGFTLNPIIGDNNEVAGIVVAGEDITERDAAHQAIQASEARLRLLTEALPVLISYVDQEHRYQYNNPQYAITFDRPLEEITGKFVWEVIGEDSYKSGLPRMNLALQGKEQHYEIDFHDPTGAFHYMQVSYIPHKENGIVVGFFAMINDLTHIKSIEKRNREQERELAHLHRISSLGEMASNLAHELNQPLTAISNYASVSRRLLALEDCCELKNADDINRALTGVEKQSHRAADIIRKVRSFVRKRSVEFCRLSMNHIVQESIDFAYLNLREKDIHVRFDPSSSNTDIQGDAIQLQQVITNLLVNGSEVTEKPDAVGTMAYIDVRVRRLKDQSIKLSVRDYGPKITQEELDHIFEPFFTTKSEGMGMGLAISTSIAEAHGGRLEAFANDDCGATMTLTLPAIKTT